MLLNMKRYKHIWIWLLVLAYIGFIFHNSMTVAVVSETASLKVSEYLLKIFNHFSLYTNDITVFNHYVRKLAHFSEFALLGFLVGIALHFCPLFKHKSLNFIFFMILIPFTDEMLQNFYDGRSAQFSDMLIDASGYIFGGLVIYIIFLIIYDIFRNRVE